jgi:hypothetical protein
LRHPALHGLQLREGLIPVISLAPWRYRRVLAVDGGPIERIESGVVSVLGVPQYQANAYLKGGLRREAGKKVLYGDADGCGTDRQPELARYKAISESLERWAHAALAPEGRNFGFDVDPSSNGMAAYPAWFAHRARERARAEATERHAIISWWIGAANAEVHTSPWAGVDLVEIESPTPGVKVALLHATAGQQMHAYGHAAGRTLEDAAKRAAIELVRAQYVIGRYERRHTESPPSASEAGLFERRCLYFAGAEGHAQFQERLQRRKARSCATRVLFDGEIPGPWSEYARVWRTVYEPPCTEFLEPREDFFFW